MYRISFFVVYWNNMKCLRFIEDLIFGDEKQIYNMEHHIYEFRDGHRSLGLYNGGNHRCGWYCKYNYKSSIIHLMKA
jgi:hypothetical protein